MTRVKTGGRQVGSKNLVSEAMRKDILSVYKSLGGRRWLLAWAKSNGTEYVKQALSRVMPPMPRQALDEQEEAEFGMLAPIGSAALMEAARRVAFILARGADAARPLDVEMVEFSPAPAPEPQDPSPEPEPPAPQPTLDELPEPLPAPAPPPSDTETLENHRGSAAEDGRSHARPEVIDKRRQAHDGYMARLATHHRRSLL